MAKDATGAAPVAAAPSPTPAAGAGARTITLPCGAVATIRKGIGKDLMRAMQVAGSSSDGIPFALVAELCTIDGAPVIYEELLERDLEDVAALVGAVTGGFRMAVPATPM